ncbi:MAG TPA: DUF6765 family protein [Usitatibacter sp.]|nr:DUF6765 family protein [Usitatibacter sp.]
MQIDFHHAATYVVARLAGFPADEAEIVAHSAQYVDDATSSGEIFFDNGGMYERMSSAHKFYDYRNMGALSNHRVWLPFHFLPGNRGEPRPKSPPVLTHEELVDRCITRPDSAPAREVMGAVVLRQNRPYALHRLGIAAHVYCDTWAHQGFVGYRDRINLATEISANDEHHERTFEQRFADFFGHGIEVVEEKLVGESLPLGHGVVLSYPDRPYLVWSYRNGHGELIQRDNPREFAKAAASLYQWFRRYRDHPKHGRDAIPMDYPLPDAFAALEKMLAEARDEKKADRHARWLRAIGDGTFGFRDELTYVESGPGSWRHAALGDTSDDDISDAGHPIHCPPEFFSSHWKLFHDALEAHRFFVLNELLPAYGILST